MRSLGRANGFIECEAFTGVVWQMIGQRIDLPATRCTNRNEMEWIRMDAKCIILHFMVACVRAFLRRPHIVCSPAPDAGRRMRNSTSTRQQTTIALNGVCDCVCALHGLRCKSSVVSAREKNEVIMRLDFIVCCAAKEFVIYSRVHSSVCVVNAYSNESYGIQLQSHCHNNGMPIQL